jgi:hypothetical protein
LACHVLWTVQSIMEPFARLGGGGSWSFAKQAKLGSFAKPGGQAKQANRHRPAAAATTRPSLVDQSKQQHQDPRRREVQPSTDDSLWWDFLASCASMHHRYPESGLLLVAGGSRAKVEDTKAHRQHTRTNGRVLLTSILKLVIHSHGYLPPHPAVASAGKHASYSLSGNVILFIRRLSRGFFPPQLRPLKCRLEVCEAYSARTRRVSIGEPSPEDRDHCEQSSGATLSDFAHLISDADTCRPCLLKTVLSSRNEITPSPLRSYMSKTRRTADSSGVRSPWGFACPPSPTRVGR